MNSTTKKSQWFRNLFQVDKTMLLATLAGLLVTAGLPPLHGTGWLVLCGMGLQFFLMVDSKRPGRTALVFGLAHQISLQYWLFLLIPAKSIPFQALVQIQAIAAILYVTVFYLIWGWSFGFLRRRAPLFKGTSGLLLLPVLWIAMEASRAQGELGYPWCISGSAFTNSPFLSLASTSGEIGLGAGLALAAALIAGFPPSVISLTSLVGI